MDTKDTRVKEFEAVLEILEKVKAAAEKGEFKAYPNLRIMNSNIDTDALLHPAIKNILEQLGYTVIPSITSFSTEIHWGSPKKSSLSSGFTAIQAKDAAEWVNTQADRALAKEWESFNRAKISVVKNPLTGSSDTLEITAMEQRKAWEKYKNSFTSYKPGTFVLNDTSIIVANDEGALVPYDEPPPSKL